MDIKHIREAAQKMEAAFRSAEAAKLAQEELALLFPDETTRRAEIGRALSDQAKRARDLVEAASGLLRKAADELHEKWAEGERAMRGEGEFRQAPGTQTATEGTLAAGFQAQAQARKHDVYVVEGNVQPRRLAKMFPTGWTRIRVPNAAWVNGVAEPTDVLIATQHKHPNELAGTIYRRIGELSVSDVERYQMPHRETKPASKRELESAARDSSHPEFDHSIAQLDAEIAGLTSGDEPAAPEGWVMQAWITSESKWDGEPYAADLGRQPNMIDVTVPHAVTWSRDTRPAMVSRAVLNLSDQGYKFVRVFVYPSTERDPGGRAQAEILSEYEEHQARPAPKRKAKRKGGSSGDALAKAIEADEKAERGYQRAINSVDRAYDKGVTSDQEKAEARLAKAKLRMVKAEAKRAELERIARGAESIEEYERLLKEKPFRYGWDVKQQVVMREYTTPSGVDRDEAGEWRMRDGHEGPPPVYVGLPVTARRGAHKRSGIVVAVNPKKTRVTVRLREEGDTKFSWRDKYDGYWPLGESSGGFGKLLLGRAVDYLDPSV